MPLLHRKLFDPVPLPTDLDPDEEVFHCPLTNEIFREYEDFYERTILCNSLVWSCSITEKPNLTYQEALDCEMAAKKKLSKVSPTILKPILYLVGLSNHSRVDELNEELYNFIKDRYFVGEHVEVQIKKKKLRHSGRVLQVLAPSSTMNGHMTATNTNAEQESESADEDDMPLSNFQSSKPHNSLHIRYVVRLADGTNAHVSSASIRRKQGVCNRQSSKLYLKANCYKPNGLATDPYHVKEEVKQKLKLDRLKWEDIFIGPKPSFLSTPKQHKGRKFNSSNDSSKTMSARERLEFDQAREQKENEMRVARELEREERKKTKEEMRKKKCEEMEKLKEAARLDKERKRKEREEEMMKMRMEREHMKHQKQEEKRRLAEYLKEWSRPRDDLECDDLMDLPPAHEISSLLPPSLFGDVLSLLEFFNNFGDLFDAADEFPHGLSISQLVKALVGHSHDGPLCDLLFFFLSNLFRTQAAEEEGCEEPHFEVNDPEVALQLSEKVTEDSLQAFATITSTWTMTHQGFPLQKLELDSYTVSEILRLYLLSSASRPRAEDRLWRFQSRGGYSVMDDTPSYLYIHRPDIIDKLSTMSVFDLMADEKLEIIMCLLHHLLSFVAPRDHLDECAEKLQQSQQAYRDDRAAEKKRERELAIDKSKFKYEQLCLEKQARYKEVEENMKRDEAKNVVDNGENLHKKKEEKDEDGEEDEGPKLLEPLERAEKLRLFDDEENQAKEAWNFRRHNHLLTIDQQRASFRVCPIGQDRYYRRYWNITSLPGLLVEEFPDHYLTDDLLSIRVPQKPRSIASASGYSTPGVVSDCSATATPTNLTFGTTTSRPINGVFSPLSITHNCSSLPTTPVAMVTGSSSPKHTIVTSSSEQAIIVDEERPLVGELTQGKQHKWSIYKNIDEIDSLIASLNTRGFRESKLRNNLTSIKEVIASRMTARTLPLAELQEMCEDDESCQMKMEKLLREQIVDLEGRIWSGNLGQTKVTNRDTWREAIQNGGDYHGNEDTSLPIITEDEEDDVVCSSSVMFPSLPGRKIDDRCSERNKDVGQLATALLVVERSIDRKYLKNPLGWAVDTRKGIRGRPPNDAVDEDVKKKCILLLKKWEQSLLQSTSLSQVFLHLSTLERSIAWSRSILNAKCRICRRKGDGEKMLLCDSCDRGHHMYCLRPTIKNIPAGDWYCPDCRPKSAKISPRKVMRTKKFVQDDSSSEEDSIEEEEDDSPEEEEEPVRKKLTYKLPVRSKKLPSNKVNGKRKNRSSGVVVIGPSKRRSAGVWKDLSSCEEILSEMIKHPDSWPFLDPVSRKLVPDYYSIIKKPMDLGTVLKKLKNVQYNSPSEFVDDVTLIFDNCHEYNDPRSNIARTASYLKNFFDSRIDEKGLGSYRSVDDKAKRRKVN